MTLYEHIDISVHAARRMRQRRISREDVEVVLRFGEGRPGEEDTWIYELGHIRVVVVEYESSARVDTVVRLKCTS
jgi:urease accessory protein UreE